MNQTDQVYCEEIAGEIVSIFRRERERLGFSKSELSQRSGVSRSAILRLETREIQPTLITLIKISTAMNIDMWKILKEAYSNTSR